MKIEELIKTDLKKMSDQELINSFNLVINYVSEQSEIIYMTTPKEDFLDAVDSELIDGNLGIFLIDVKQELDSRGWRPKTKKITFSFEKIEEEEK